MADPRNKPEPKYMKGVGRGWKEILEQEELEREIAVEGGKRQTIATWLARLPFMTALIGALTIVIGGIVSYNMFIVQPRLKKTNGVFNAADSIAYMNRRPKESGDKAAKRLATYKSVSAKVDEQDSLQKLGRARSVNYDSADVAQRAEAGAMRNASGEQGAVAGGPSGTVDQARLEAIRQAALAKDAQFRGDLADRMHSGNMSATQARTEAAKIRDEANTFKSQIAEGDAKFGGDPTWKATRDGLSQQASSMQDAADKLSATHGSNTKMRALGEQLRNGK